MRLIHKRAKRSQAGFSLAETLIAILILLMVSAVVAGAIPAASTAYAKTVDAANAQVLLSTTITVLRDELGTAIDIEDPEGTTITYRNGNNGFRKIVLQGVVSKEDEEEESEEPAVEPGVWLCVGEYHKEDGTVTYSVPGNKSKSRLIVSSKAATENLIVSYASITKSADGVITVTDLVVKKGDTTLAGPESISIRPVS